MKKFGFIFLASLVCFNVSGCDVLPEKYDVFANANCEDISGTPSQNDTRKGTLTVQFQEGTSYEVRTWTNVTKAEGMRLCGLANYGGNIDYKARWCPDEQPVEKSAVKQLFNSSSSGIQTGNTMSVAAIMGGKPKLNSRWRMKAALPSGKSTIIEVFVDGAANMTAFYDVESVPKILPIARIKLYPKDLRASIILSANDTKISTININEIKRHPGINAVSYTRTDKPNAALSSAMVECKKPVLTGLHLQGTKLNIQDTYSRGDIDITTTTLDNQEFYSYDWDNDGFDDLVKIDKNNNGKTHLTVYSGYRDYVVPLFDTDTALHATNANWTFQIVDWDKDGYPDLLSINRQGAHNKTEVHILSGKDKFNSFILHTGTGLNAVSPSWKFAVCDWNKDGVKDLVALDTQASGFTDIHILSGGSNFKQFLLQKKTGLEAVDSQWKFSMGDSDLDKVPDLMIVKKQGETMTELHSLSGASNFKNFNLHETTRFPKADSSWDFVVVDHAIQQ